MLQGFCITNIHQKRNTPLPLPNAVSMSSGGSRRAVILNFWKLTFHHVIHAATTLRGFSVYMPRHHLIRATEKENFCLQTKYSGAMHCISVIWQYFSLQSKANSMQYHFSLQKCSKLKLLLHNHKHYTKSQHFFLHFAPLRTK